MTRADVHHTEYSSDKMYAIDFSVTHYHENYGWADIKFYVNGFLTEVREHVDLDDARRVLKAFRKRSKFSFPTFWSSFELDWARQEETLPDWEDNLCAIYGIEEYYDHVIEEEEPVALAELGF